MSVEVVGPDGKNYAFPDGTTREQAIAFFKKGGTSSGPASASASSPAKQPEFKKGVFEPRRRLKEPEPSLLEKAAEGYGKYSRGLLTGAASASGIPESTSPTDILSSLGPLGFLKHPVDTAKSMYKDSTRSFMDAGHELNAGLSNPRELPQRVANFASKSIQGIPMVGPAIRQYGPEISQGLKQRDIEQTAHGVGGLVTTAALLKGGESAATETGPLSKATAASQRVEAGKILNKLLRGTRSQIAPEAGAALAREKQIFRSTNSMKNYIIEKTDQLSDAINRRVNVASGQVYDIKQQVNSLVAEPIRKLSKLATAGNQAAITKLQDLGQALNQKPLNQMTVKDLIQLRRAIKDQAFTEGGGFVKVTSRRVYKLVSEKLHEIDPKLEELDTQTHGMIDAEKAATRRAKDILVGKAPDPVGWLHATLGGSLAFAGVYTTLHSIGGAIGAALAYPGILELKKAYMATPSATTRAFLRMKLADFLDSTDKIGKATKQASPGPGGASPNPARTLNPPSGPGLPPSGAFPGASATPAGASPRATVYNAPVSAKPQLGKAPALLTEGSTKAANPSATEPSAKPSEASTEPKPKTESKTRYAVQTTPHGDLKATFVDGVLKNIKMGRNTYKNVETIQAVLKKTGLTEDQLRKDSEGPQPASLHGEGTLGKRAKQAERKAAEREIAKAQTPGGVKQGGQPQIKEPTAQTGNPEALLIAIDAAKDALPRMFGRKGQLRLDEVMTRAAKEKWDPSTTYNAIFDLIEDLQKP